LRRKKPFSRGKRRPVQFARNSLKQTRQSNIAVMPADTSSTMISLINLMPRDEQTTLRPERKRVDYLIMF
jgi:hypothetical protein